MKGYSWFPFAPGVEIDLATVNAFLAASERLSRFIDQAIEQLPIDPEKLVVAGFSQGGVMAYDQGLRHPTRYAGVAGLSTWLPQPLVESLPKLPEQENLPVLVVHGTEDPMLPVEQARESREALRTFGVPLTYREFSMAHEIRPEALRVGPLVGRASDPAVREVILALPATVDGQTTAHYLADRLAGADVAVTMLARGVPVGGELDWLDDGTIAQAMRARRPA